VTLTENKSEQMSKQLAPIAPNTQELTTKQIKPLLPNKAPSALRSTIVNRLNSLGVDGEEFCQKMIEFKCLMAGSFPLQCLLGEFYSDSDIDIFIKRRRSEYTGKDEINLRSFHEFEKWLYHKYGVKSEANIYIIRDVIRSRKTQVTPHAIINVILVDNEDLEKFIMDTFDLSFCRTMFDGFEVKYDEMSLKKVGYISNREGLKPYQSFYISEEQYNKKKKSKSFREDYDLDKYRVYPDPQVKLSQRIEKYKRRGFLILDNPQTEINDDNLEALRMSQIKSDYWKLSNEYSALREKNTKELNELREKLSATEKKLVEKENIINQLKLVFKSLLS